MTVNDADKASDYTAALIQLSLFDKWRCVLLGLHTLHPFYAQHLLCR
jgi:hypothetical protein